ncbi:Protein of unknown function [Microbacterium sp. cf046]|uniref:DUF3237 domain-containing protein n=1 Tax=Microbacterium sp. cf046 TaxID=1761803 RepID=UPI0008EA47CA|nr:DUF3237 domain-containing protein [Microbacterium sp. cf046]SFS14230.1 Protein of unknown function [Microbacterium sp. cf046]
MTELLVPSLEYVFEIRAEVAPPLRIGRSVAEELHLTPITGGTVSGPRLTGTVLAGGGDWWVGRGAMCQLDARYLVAAEDGAVIDVVNRGYWRPEPDAEDRVFAGEPVTEAQLYYRTAFTFQTDAASHRWLTESQFIGMARAEADAVCIRVFRIE